MFIKLRKLLIVVVHTDDTDGHGCPQAEGVQEQESSEIKRKLNGGPQADFVGERESSGINRELKEMGPQADEVRKQVPDYSHIVYIKRSSSSYASF